MLDVMIFTAHRRGEYVIDRLAALDVRMQAFDFSHHLGERDEKDLQSPFGFFDAEKWQKKHRQWLEAHHVFALQKQGLSIYSNHGTFEATGLIAAQQKELMGRWAFPAAMSLFSTIDYPIKSIDKEELFCDFFSNYYLPWATHNPKAKLMDVGREFTYSSKPGVKQLSFQQHEYKSQYVINFLSSTEIMGLQKTGLTQLLNHEALRPRQCWQRAEILMSADVDLTLMPLQTLIATRLEDPWVEDRFFILQRQENEGYYNLWYRTWYERHKSKDHFTQVSQGLEAVLKERIPGAKIQWLQIPTEIEKEEAVSLYPIFDLQEWNLQSKWLDNATYHGSSDKLPNYLWSENMKHQENLVQHFTQELKGD